MGFSWMELIAAASGITGDFSGTKSDPNVSNQLQFRVPKAKEALLLWNVKPPIFTLCVGNAWGEAALLLAAGSRVNRSAIPSSTIMIKQVNLLAKHIGKLPEEIEADTSCPKYFSPNEAVEYGIIDKVLYNERSTEDCGVVSDLKRHNLFDLLWNSQLVIIRSN
ncbi:ATP-dependent Clp protease proteolytic-related protein [Salix suchowensis]|nr:ATP-dependent Clp protease proteolytic-related protein [Salix suchowensis]